MTDNTGQEKLRMNAYYYSFYKTGNIHIDRILSAVAVAGNGSHHTEDWMDRGYVEDIQEAADKAASTLNSQQDGVWISRECAEKGFECLNECYQNHRNPNEADYNECDKEECAWCEDAAIVMQSLQQDKE